jgi:GGDEF domain-containing protein
VKYSRFEMLVLGVGVIAVLGTIAFSLTSHPDGVEVLAQVLLLVALTGAVHWGRSGGLVAAVVAFLVYLMARMPLILAVGWTTATVELVLVHGVTYGFIGIVGGELCGRLKYFFARSSESPSIDESSRVYNQQFIAKLLATALGGFDRYQAPFSVVVLRLAPAVTSELRARKASSLVRAVANHLRNDVRMIDDVGHLDDGSFVLLLPHTPRTGAMVAAERVRAGVRDVVGAKDESVTAQVMGAPEDTDALRALLADIAPKDADAAAVQVERRTVPARQDSEA